MNVLIDLSAVRTGGGLQLAMNYLLVNKSNSMLKFYIILNEELKKNNEIMNESISKDVIGFCPNNLIKRFFFEYSQIPNLIKKNKISKVFTFFGSGLPETLYTTTIVGVAYPIICYPESPYWKYIPKFEKIKKNIWNIIRINRLKKADIIIAETEVMKHRLLSLFNSEQKKIVVFPPTVSRFIDNKDLVFKTNSCFTVLVLSGLAFHKNNWRFYEVACILNDQNISLKFLCSFSRNDFISHTNSMIDNDIDSLIVDKYFEFVGTVKPDKINSLYDRSNALINISDLESYSNNYMESWKASVLLICSDRDFAHSICRDSALYCEPHSPISIANALIKAVNLNEVEFKSFLRNGKLYLNELPSIEDKNAFINSLLLSQ